MGVEIDATERRLAFSGDEVDMAMLEGALRKIPDAEHIIFTDTPLNEDQLQPILIARETLRLIRIESLNGDYPRFRISHRGADLLSRFTQLRVMLLLGCDLDFSPAQNIPESAHFVELYLDACTFSYETLREFISSWRFSSLSLRETKLTDKMVAALVQRSGLTKLFLSGASFEVSSLRYLEEMKNLKEIRLTNTGIDGQIVARIQEALPNTVIYWQDVW